MSRLKTLPIMLAGYHAGGIRSEESATVLVPYDMTSK